MCVPTGQESKSGCLGRSGRISDIKYVLVKSLTLPPDPPELGSSAPPILMSLSQIVEFGRHYGS